jgi:hypothetical protein
MKINPVNVLLAVLVSAIMAFGLWSFDGELKNYVAVGAFFFFAGTLLPMIGGGFESARRGLNLRTVSSVFFVLGLMVNGFFAMLGLSATAYVIVSALVFLVYVFLANAIYSARQ